MTDHFNLFFLQRVSDPLTRRSGHLKIRFEECFSALDEATAYLSRSRAVLIACLVRNCICLRKMGK